MSNSNYHHSCILYQVWYLINPPSYSFPLGIEGGTLYFHVKIWIRMILGNFCCLHICLFFLWQYLICYWSHLSQLSCLCVSSGLCCFLTFESVLACFLLMERSLYCILFFSPSLHAWQFLKMPHSRTFFFLLNGWIFSYSCEYSWAFFWNAVEFLQNTDLFGSCYYGIINKFGSGCRTMGTLFSLLR